MGARGVDWARAKFLLTSMDADGTKNGFEIELTRKISESVNVPVIASGGAGKLGKSRAFRGSFRTKWKSRRRACREHFSLSGNRNSGVIC
jgi:hypothetical protein